MYNVITRLNTLYNHARFLYINRNDMRESNVKVTVNKTLLWLNRFIRIGSSAVVRKVFFFFFFLIQKFHLLWTFRWRLPSFSTLDEWLVMRTGNTARCSSSWVARLFSWGFWSRRHQKFIKNVSELILAFVSVHSLSPLRFLMSILLL